MILAIISKSGLHTANLIRCHRMPRFKGFNLFVFFKILISPK